jgi:hypothetical protein
MTARGVFFGTASDDAPSPWNLLYAHLDTVTAFLYASDSTRFSVRMGSKASKADYHRTTSFAKRIMEEWGSSNADLIYEMGILWSLVYDSTIIKHIRRGGKVCISRRSGNGRRLVTRSLVG